MRSSKSSTTAGANAAALMENHAAPSAVMGSGAKRTAPTTTGTVSAGRARMSLRPTRNTTPMDAKATTASTKAPAQPEVATMSGVEMSTNPTEGTRIGRGLRLASNTATWRHGIDG